MAKGATSFISHISLRTKIIGLFAVVFLALMVVFSIFTFYQQLNRMESEVLERARMLDQEMMATWDFISLNQNTINYDSEGSFDYKGLHCALAGKSVAVLFGKRSDDTIRFTKMEPRNIYNRPDEFETQALQLFGEDKSVQEYYEFTDYRGEPAFRYVSVMKVTKDCIECHGHPKGKVDITGYPKEGILKGLVTFNQEESDENCYLFINNKSLHMGKYNNSKYDGAINILKEILNYEA